MEATGEQTGVGAQLARARQAQRRTISDVSQQTKIQPWVLEALEADRFQDTMSPIYVRGFLAMYARFLHLDPEPLLAQVAWPKDPVQEEQAQTPPPVRALSFSIRIPWDQLGRLLRPAALVAGIAAVMLIRPWRWLPTVSVPHKEASVSVVKEPTPPPKVTPQILATIPAPKPLEVSVTVNGPTWIRVRADGKLLAQERLRRGAQETWTASKQLEVVVAKPSQVELTLNGRSISPFAVANHGRLLITHSGVSALPDEQF